MQSPTVLAEEPDDDTVLPPPIRSSRPDLSIFISGGDDRASSTEYSTSFRREENRASKSQRTKGVNNPGDIESECQGDADLGKEVQNFVEIQMRTMATEISKAEKSASGTQFDDGSKRLSDGVEFLERWIFGGAEAWLGYFDEADWFGSIVLDFGVNTILRSVGQVIFSDNPVSGLLIILALLLDDEGGSGTVGLGILNVVVANLFVALLFSENEAGGDESNAMRHGLYGFNPFLVGQSIVFFSQVSVGV